MLGLTLDDIEEFRIKLLAAIYGGGLSVEACKFAMNAQHELSAFRGALEAYDGITYTSPSPQDIASVLQVHAMEELDRLLPPAS